MNGAEHHLLHYSGRAIRSIKYLARHLASKDPFVESYFGWLADALHRSVKFLGPRDGLLVDDDVVDMSRVMGPWRLPASCMAVEFSVTPGTYGLLESAPYLTTRRLVLGIDLGDEMERKLACSSLPGLHALAGDDDSLSDHYLIVPVDSLEGDAMRLAPPVPGLSELEQIWFPGAIALLVPREQAPGKTLRLEDEIVSPGARRQTIRLDFMPIPTLSSYYRELATEAALSERPPVEWYEAASDSLLEAASLLTLSAALSCRNVSHAVVGPSLKLQQSRARKGKAPLYDYRVLSVDLDKGSSSTGVRGPHQGGSVRTHFRRGHIRRYPSHQVWINQVVVAPHSSRGFADKCYRPFSK